MCQSVCAKAVLKEKFTMTILDSVKGTVNTAVDTISSVAQTIVEQNKRKAQQIKTCYEKRKRAYEQSIYCSRKGYVRQQKERH